MDWVGLGKVRWGGLSWGGVARPRADTEGLVPAPRWHVRCPVVSCPVNIWFWFDASGGQAGAFALLRG